MNKIILRVSKEYSLTPGSRFKSEGNFSGEDFRDSLLIHLIRSCIRNERQLEIDLDGTAGYGSGFLEESFGGLVRVHKINCEDIKKILIIKSSEEPYLENDLIYYLNEASVNGNKI